MFVLTSGSIADFRFAEQQTSPGTAVMFAKRKMHP